MWHPIRLAEDYAMADIVTDGRVIMGVGRGYHTREVETFGAPADRRRRRTASYFEEQLQLMLAAASTRRARASRASTSPVPPEVEYRGYQLTRHHHGAAADAPAGGDLACRSPAARPST